MQSRYACFTLESVLAWFFYILTLPYPLPVRGWQFPPRRGDGRTLCGTRISATLCDDLTCVSSQWRLSLFIIGGLRAADGRGEFSLRMFLLRLSAWQAVEPIQSKSTLIKSGICASIVLKSLTIRPVLSAAFALYCLQICRYGQGGLTLDRFCIPFFGHST